VSPRRISRLIGVEQVRVIVTGIEAEAKRTLGLNPN
jgi:hypothetical protein